MPGWSATNGKTANLVGLVDGPALAMTADVASRTAPIAKPIFAFMKELLFALGDVRATDFLPAFLKTAKLRSLFRTRIVDRRNACEAGGVCVRTAIVRALQIAGANDGAGGTRAERAKVQTFAIAGYSAARP